MATISDTILTNLRLAGDRAYTAGMNAASAATNKLAVANERVEATSKKMGGQLNQSVFNMGNVVQMAGRMAFALGAIGTVATVVGLKFNGSMEQMQVAFGELLHSGSKANEMLSQLFDLAARTPFEFPQITDAAQKLLGFGMQADAIIPLLTKVGDAVAAVGADPERIDRITRALGQMQAKGKVYSEELLQLADAGLPAYQMLAQGLGVTGDKLNGMLRKGQISAKQGLDILASQMEKRYKGMAEKQSKTFNGLLSTIRDYSRMILGFAVKPLFDYLEKKVLPMIAKVETSIVRWGRSGGFDRFQKNLQTAFNQAQQPPGQKKKGLFTPDKQLGTAQKIGAALGKIWKAVSGYFRDLMDALAPAKPFWDNVLGPFLKGFVVGAFGGFVAILKLAIPVIKIFATVLGWLGKKLSFMSKVFYWLGFAIGFIFGPGKIFSTLTRALGAVGRVLGLVIRPFAWLIKLVTSSSGAFGKAAWAILQKLAPAGSKMESFLLRWLELWGKVVKVVSKIAGFITKNIAAIAGAFYAMGSAIANKFWNGLKSKGAKVLGLILGGPVGGYIFGKVGGAFGGGGDNKPSGPSIPAGGSPYGPSAAAGPDTRGAAFRKNELGNLRIDNYTILDGKVVAKSVAKNTDDKMARR
jgi:tape measure domain-containing protein